MALALEDVLETGDVHEAVAGQPLPIEDYENLHYLLGRRYRNKRNKEVVLNTAALVAAGGGAASVSGANGAGGEETEAKDAETLDGHKSVDASRITRTESDSKLNNM